MIAAATVVAGAIAGCHVFPASNPWNQRVDRLPVAPDSARLIASIGADETLHPDFGSGLWQGGKLGIPVTVVRGTQPKVRVRSSTPARATRARTRSRAA